MFITVDTAFHSLGINDLSPDMAHASSSHDVVYF